MMINVSQTKLCVYSIEFGQILPPRTLQIPRTPSVLAIFFNNWIADVPSFPFWSLLFVTSIGVLHFQSSRKEEMRTRTSICFP